MISSETAPIMAQLMVNEVIHFKALRRRTGATLLIDFAIPRKFRAWFCTGAEKLAREGGEMIILSVCICKLPPWWYMPVCV